LRVVIGGGRGFIGTHLARELRKRGHQVVLISRTATPSNLTWDEIKTKGVPQCDAVVQLSGENIMEKPWTDEQKKILLQSRVEPTKLLVEKIMASNQPPKVFLSASAIGIYPTQGQEVFAEDYAGPPAKSFGGEICTRWEEASQPLENTKTRRVITRIGLVLGHQGMLLNLRLPLGLAYVGRIGNGNQSFPWVHVDDLVNLMIFAIERDDVHGVIHGVAPQAITQAEFASTLMSVFRRPALPIPKFVVDFMFGERSCLLTEGQAVVPRLTEQYGYHFSYRDIHQALTNIRDTKPIADV